MKKKSFAVILCMALIGLMSGCGELDIEPSDNTGMDVQDAVESLLPGDSNLNDNDGEVTDRDGIITEGDNKSTSGDGLADNPPPESVINNNRYHGTDKMENNTISPSDATETNIPNNGINGDTAQDSTITSGNTVSE